MDCSGAAWVYRPESHKTEHHGKMRDIFPGPKAQSGLSPWVRPDPTLDRFSPKEAMDEFRAEGRRGWKTRVPPSQRCRRRRSPKKSPGERFTRDFYRRSMAKACRKAGIPHRHPNQARNLAATRLRKQFELEAARVILGHGSTSAAEIYAQLDGE